jgi:hypothetical protein
MTSTLVSRRTRAALIAATLAALCAAPLATAEPARTTAPSLPASTLHVPRVSGPIRLNAETADKTAWDADVGVTPNFKDAAGRGMVPFTQAKSRWHDGTLYFLLYAGDLDLEGHEHKRDGDVERDDSFRMEFGRGDEVRVVSISVLGTVADALCTTSAAGRTCDPSWQSGVRLAVDRDGSLNKIGDNDEEWVVELAIPLAKLGVKRPAPGTKIPFSIKRCEIGHDGPHACGSWGAEPPGELMLDP